MIEADAVWLITGCSRGLGRALAREALAAGHRVVATARRVDDLAALVDENGERVAAIGLDVTRPAEIGAAIELAERRFGGVDVLVNNAGYGYVGAIEEGEEAAIRAQFETNVFGPLSLVRATLPAMRSRGRGHVVNVSSIGGLVTFPAIGYYHMTKFALEALSETLAQELAPFGIGVTVVEPGAFRTDFRSDTSMRQSSTRLAAYADTAGRARDRVLQGHGTQRGDPALAARAIIIGAVVSERPPVHLLLGTDALDQVRAKLASLGREIDAWEQVTRGTDLVAAA